MTEATISSRNQIVVTKEARAALGVKAGDKLIVAIQGRAMILMAKPKSHVKALRGLTKGIYANG